jgi:UDP-N-acetylglucosamine transferase subunit ALG13
VILCLLGTNPYSFERLAKAVDDFAGETGECVVIQLGYTDFKPKNCAYFSFKSNEEIKSLMGESDFIVMQGGYGSLLEAVLMNKRVLAVPRSTENGECLDDQEEIVRFLEQENIIASCYPEESIGDKLLKFWRNGLILTPYSMTEGTKAVDLVEEYLIKSFERVK